MALRRTLSKRLFKAPIEPPPIQQSPIPSNAAKSIFHREHLTSPESTLPGGLFRRFLQQRAINQAAMFPELLREKLRSIDVTGDRIRLDGLTPPATVTAGISVAEVKKVLRSAQMEKVRCALREIRANSVTYKEYIHICSDICSSWELGEEIAKRLDESGNVIVLGDVVFLRPDQVAKSMEKLISESIATPNDPRRKELENLEKQKAFIDKKARKQVQTELYCGLGFLALQTLGFMRLTFWELNWDVMEPICFFVTSFHFAIAYGFFLRTSKEPTFEGLFKQRFKTKQKKLMEARSFDLEKYDKLCRAFYPNHVGFEMNGPFPGSEFSKAIH